MSENAFKRALFNPPTAELDSAPAVEELSPEITVVLKLSIAVLFNTFI